MAKKTRKELLKKEDAFQAAAGQSAAWLAENKALAIWSSVGVLAIIAAIWGGAEYLRVRNIDASTLLEAAFELQAAQVIVETEETKADPTASMPTFASEADRDAAVVAKLEEAMRAAGGSGVGDLARFAIAGIKEKSGDVDGARAIFAELVDGLSAGDSLYFVAVERLAYIQEAKGELDAAITTLSRLSGADRFYADFAAYHQARLYQIKGDTERAKNLLERVKKEYPESAIKDEVQKRLEKLGAGDGAGAEQAKAAPTADSPLEDAPADDAADEGVAAAEGAQ